MGKFLIVLVGMFVATAAFAESESSSSRGYLVEAVRDGRAITFYAGLTDEQVDIQFDLDFFSDKQLKVVANCMKKRDTHAVLVITETKAIEVPTGIPGRTTYAHPMVVTDVDCIRAPKFIKVWRKAFKAE